MLSHGLSDEVSVMTFHLAEEGLNDRPSFGSLDYLEESDEAKITKIVDQMPNVVLLRQLKLEC